MGVVENARFSEFLRGKEGLESVYQLIQAEMKLLEQMELYIEKRAVIDIEYAEKLAKLHEKVKLGESNVYTDGSLIEKAWRTYMTESENKAIIIRGTARSLQANTIPRINTLLLRKKDSASSFQKNKQKLDIEFARVHDEMTRLQNLYGGILKDCTKAKEKLDESYQKPKGQKDWNKFKERFDHVSRKLHMNHNEYMLSICALNERQKHKETSLIPHLLESIQDIEERYIIPWKEIFQEILSNSSWCRQEFITSESELNQSIELISGDSEFLSFLNNHKQNPAPVLNFLFDKSLTKDENSTSGLTNDSLAINDLTHDQLQNKKQSFEDEKKLHEKNIEIKKEEVEKEEKTLKDMSTGDSKTVFSTIEQCHQCSDARIDLKELECKRSMVQAQYDIVNTAFLNTQYPARRYIELNPPNGSKSNGDASASLPKDVTGRPLPETPTKVKRRTTTLPKIMAQLRRHSSAQSSPNAHKKIEVRRTTVQQPSDDESDEPYDDPVEDVLDSSSWYHGKVDRQTVSRLLKNDGDFIVREKSDGSGDKVLSVLWRRATKHIILKPDSDEMFKLESDAFPTIPELINHHHERNLVIQASSGVILLNPIHRVFIEGDGYVTKHDQVKLDQKLGSGHFGEVWRGVLLNKSLPVAVKICKPKDDVVNQRQKFLEEAEIMKDCNHTNVVKLIGVCKGNDPYYIILELCEKGDLLAVLRKESVRLTPKNFLQMAIDVAYGMAYLEQKQIIHRDLAARNCLVKMDYTVKICDFGMSREEDDDGIYSIKETKEIPFKWCAPEVWQFNQYSAKTDVWSYGVVLWEIFSQGQQPYTGWSNKDAKMRIDQGYRLPAPNGTPPDIYSVMSNCWHEDPVQRFSFPQLCTWLDEIKKKLAL